MNKKFDFTRQFSFYSGGEIMLTASLKSPLATV